MGDGSTVSDSGPSPDGPSDASPKKDASSGGDAASWPTPPGPAAGAGFTHLVFEDDFTTADTIATTQNAASGYKWYWSFDITSAPPWSVHTTATAASSSDAGPGDNASPAGGILSVYGPGAPNDALVTVPGWALNNSNAVLPAEGQGNWAHAYFEAYVDTPLDGNASSSTSSGWPAFWSWSIQGLKNFGFGGSSLTTASYSEIDFFETYGTLFGDQPGDWTATMHQWPADAASDGNTQHTDGGWHTYGCLWTSSGAGTGQVKFYYDGAQVDDTIDSGTGQTQFSLENMSQFVVLGSGKDWSMNVDWVRVWQ
jgi:hypothetical protein